MNFQGWEWIIILVALGASSREFKKGLEDGTKDAEADVDVIVEAESDE
jgi:Sec-independent protein translocase protein TatA